MNLLYLIERDTKLRKVAGTRGGEWHGPCPFCGGKDRLIVQPNHGRGRWSCRQCSPRWNDDISYIMRREQVGFVEARRRAGRPIGYRPLHTGAHPPPRRLADVAEAGRNAAWQVEGFRFAMTANRALFQPEGAQALAYLRRRGLERTALAMFSVGYNAEDRRANWGGVDVFLPRGIVLPWFDHDTLVKLNIRRPTGAPKYLQVRGGANGLYGWDLVAPDAVMVLVEGELDALSLWPPRGLPDTRRVLPLATGSVTGARLLPYLGGLAAVRRVLLAFDADAAGDSAAAWWQARLGPLAQRLRPTRHDVNAMCAAGDDLWAWIEQGMGMKTED